VNCKVTSIRWLLTVSIKFSSFRKCLNTACWLWLVYLGSGWAHADQPVAGSELTDFDQANAILTRFCSGCHHDGNAEGDFSVSSYESLLAVTSQGKPRIVPGKPDQSLIFQVLTGHAEPAMPPSDEPQLNASQIAVIEKWIAQGANLSSDPSPPLRILSP